MYTTTTEQITMHAYGNPNPLDVSLYTVHRACCRESQFQCQHGTYPASEFRAEVVNQQILLLQQVGWLMQVFAGLINQEVCYSCCHLDLHIHLSSSGMGDADDVYVLTLLLPVTLSMITSGLDL